MTRDHHIVVRDRRNNNNIVFDGTINLDYRLTIITGKYMEHVIRFCNYLSINKSNKCTIIDNYRVRGMFGMEHNDACINDEDASYGYDVIGDLNALLYTEYNSESDTVYKHLEHAIIVRPERYYTIGEQVKLVCRIMSMVEANPGLKVVLFTNSETLIQHVNLLMSLHGNTVLQDKYKYVTIASSDVGGYECVRINGTSTIKSMKHNDGKITSSSISKVMNQHTSMFLDIINDRCRHDPPSED